eukprot:IDg1808t1
MAASCLSQPCAWCAKTGALRYAAHKWYARAVMQISRERLRINRIRTLPLAQRGGEVRAVQAGAVHAVSPMWPIGGRIYREAVQRGAERNPYMLVLGRLKSSSLMLRKVFPNLRRKRGRASNVDDTHRWSLHVRRPYRTIKAREKQFDRVATDEIKEMQSSVNTEIGMGGRGRGAMKQAMRPRQRFNESATGIYNLPTLVYTHARTPAELASACACATAPGSRRAYRCSGARAAACPAAAAAQRRGQWDALLALPRHVAYSMKARL